MPAILYGVAELIRTDGNYNVRRSLAETLRHSISPQARQRTQTGSRGHHGYFIEGGPVFTRHKQAVGRCIVGNAVEDIFTATL